MKLLLENRNFRILWISTTFSQAASNILQFALSLYVLQVTGSATKFATMLSITFIPRIILGPVAGVLGDKWDRKRALFIITFLESLVFLITVLISNFIGSVTLLLIYFLVISLEILEILLSAPMVSVIPSIVQKEEIGVANSLMQLDDSIISIIGPMIGVFIYTKFSVKGNLAAAGILVFITSILFLFIQIPKRKVIIKSNLNSTNSVFRNFIKDFKEGLNYVKKEKLLRNFMIVAIVINFLLAPTFSVVNTYYLLNELKVEEYTLGLIQSLMALFSLIAPILTMLFLKNSTVINVFKKGIIGITVGIFFLIISSFTFFNKDLSKNYIIALLIIGTFFVVVSATIMNISLGTYFGENIEENFMGRVTSIMGTLCTIAIPIGQQVYSRILAYSNSFYSYLLSLILMVFSIYLTSFIMTEAKTQQYKPIKESALEGDV